EKIFPAGCKRIDQYTGFLTKAAMPYAGGYKIAIAFFQKPLLSCYVQLKNTAFHIAYLQVRVLVLRSYSAGCKLHFYHHHLIIMHQHLPGNAVAQICPFDFTVYLKKRLIIHEAKIIKYSTGSGWGTFIIVAPNKYIIKRKYPGKLMLWL